MKLNYKIAPGLFYTAFYCIENGKLFAAYGDEENYAPVFPVVKESNKRYTFFCTVRSQEFVDTVLNTMWLNIEDSNKKFSIVLRDKETCVSSNGTIIFAVGNSMEALHFATKQIYEKLWQFKKPHFDRYKEELEINVKKVVDF